MIDILPAHKEFLDLLADEIVKRLRVAQVLDLEGTISMEEAAEILGVKTTNVNSLRVTFTKFANSRQYVNPLPAYYVGRVRRYKRSEVVHFLNNRQRHSKRR